MTEMPSYADVAARASEGNAFSNGTEGDAWMEGWCGRPGAYCVHDNIVQGGDVSCPLLEVAMLGGTPAEWGERKNVLGPGMYECSMYEADMTTAPYESEVPGA